MISSTLAAFVDDHGLQALGLLMTWATVLLGAAWLITRLLRRASAAVRYGVWQSAWLGLLVLPAVFVLLPGIPLGLTPAESEITTAISDSGLMNQAAIGASVANDDLAPAIQPISADAPTYQPHSGMNQAMAAKVRDHGASLTQDIGEQPIDSRAAAGPVSVAMPRAPWPWRLVIAWALGVIVQLGWLLWCVLRAGRLVRAASPVDDSMILRVHAEISRRHSRSRPVRLRMSSAVRIPLAVGVRRPTIVLPAGCAEWPAEKMRMVLSHELAHVERRDVFWQLAARTAAAFYWFHPLTWLGLRRMRQERERACDDRVLSSGVPAIDYAAGLAEFAAAVAGRRLPAVGSLGMAEQLPLEDRVRSILDTATSRQPVSATARGILLAGTMCFVLLLGVLRPFSSIRTVAAETDDQAIAAPAGTATQADGETEAPASEPKEAAGVREGKAPTPGRMVVRAVDDTTGEPLAHVQFRLHGRVGDQAFNQFFESDDEGIAQGNWPPDAVVEILWLSARKANFVPIEYLWHNDKHPITMPARVDLRFQRGAVIVGTVRDEASRPIAGAEIKISMPITSPRLADYIFYAATLKTDEHGEWIWTDAPADRSGIGIGVAHPDYLSGSSPSKQGENNIAVLKQGYRLVGQVVDPKGDGVAGAAVRLCFDLFNADRLETTTDVAGRFVLKNCKPGKSLVTVQANGFAPALRELVLNDQTENPRFQLEPGHSLTLKVVDIDGRPLQGVALVPDTWRGCRSLDVRFDTDAEGQVTWPNAPADVVHCEVLKAGYLSVRHRPLTAGPEVQTVTLHRELVIQGRVTDADTGKPIERFGLREGVIFANRKAPSWSRDEPDAYTGGVYQCKFSEGYDGRVLQVIAEGYLPATSRIFRPTEGTQTFDFALKPGTGPKGVVLLPDGSPAQAAEVALATKEHRAVIQRGGFDRHQNGAAISTTDAEGRFTFPPPADESFMIIVVHEAGFAKRLSEDLATGPITLEPWGRVEGRVLLGTKPDANRKVDFTQADRSASDRIYFEDYGYYATTDGEGEFTIERVVPGSAVAGRGIVTQFRRSSYHSYGWQVPVEVKPGAVVKVVIGGSGRTVVGRVAVKEGVAVDWATNMPAALNVWDKEAKRRGVVAAVATIDETGRFELPDVPAGDYVLSVPVHEPPAPDEMGSGRMIGAAHLEFTVPEMSGGRSDEPLDLGVIEASMFGKR